MHGITWGGEEKPSDACRPVRSMKLANGGTRINASETDTNRDHVEKDAFF